MIGDKKLRGFTLIEILVAVSIFAVIILVTSSIFRNVLVNQKTAADDSETREDVKYFLEIFSREAKDAVRNTSTAPVCGVEPDHMFGGNASSTELYFQNVSGNCVAYFTELDNDINRLKIQRDGADFFVSSAKINVSALSFITDDAADVQPIVTMNIQVLSQVDQTIPAYNIQTTISPREMMAPAAPPAPVIFSPSSVSGLNLWLKADAGVTTTTGDAVTTWSDQSGNGNNATQASGAYQPILNPGVLNGYNAVTFNNKTMNLASNIQLTSDFTYFQVFKKAVASTVWAGMGLANSGNDRSSFYQWDDGNIYIQNSTGSWSAIAYSSNVNWVIMDVKRSGNLANNVSLYSNSSLVGPTTLGGVFNFNDLCLNGGYPGYTNNADFAEIIVYNSALSDTDRQKVETYLNNKYSIY